MGLALDIPQTVVLDGGGAGSVVFGPPPVLTRWMVDRLTVEVVAGGGIPVVKVWEGDATGGRLADGTYSGDLDISSPADLALDPGEYLTFTWEDGAAGSTVRARITGRIASVA